MIRLPQHLCFPYDEISRMLEKVPGGLTIDQLSTKLFTVKRLKKKDLETLLQYCRERDRIEVTSVLRKGVNTSPLLRHRKHASTPAEIDNPTPESTPGTVHIATQGRAELIKKDTPKMTTTTETAGCAFLRDHPHLTEASAEILDALQRTPTGLTRSALREHSPQYHKLRGDDRTGVIQHLIDHEGVRDIPPVRGSGNTLYYPGHYEALNAPANNTHIDLFNQACDNHKEDDVDSILESEEDNVGNLLQPGEAPHYRGNMSVHDIGERIVELLKERDSGEMTLSEIYEALPEYGELDDEERRQCTRRLIEARVIGLGRRTSPYAKGAGFLSVWLITEDTKDTVVHQQADRNGDKPLNAMALALSSALSKKNEPVQWGVTANKPEVANPVDTPVVNEPVKQGVATSLPAVPAPVVSEDKTPDASVTPPSTYAEVQAQIAHLQGIAEKLAQEERDAALRASLQPLYSELAAEHQALRKAADDQQQALNNMADVMGRISALLGN